MGYPDTAVGIGQWDAALLMVISLCSFFGQTFLNRSFQIITAAKGSSIMCTQVRRPLHVQEHHLHKHRGLQWTWRLQCDLHP